MFDPILPGDQAVAQKIFSCEHQYEANLRHPFLYIHHEPIETHIYKNLHALGMGSGRELERLAREARVGVSAGGLGVCCCASVLWIVANLRCSRSTCGGRCF